MAKSKLNQMIKILNEEYKIYLSGVADSATKQAAKNFSKEKDVNGDPFAELKPFTVSEKKKLGYGGKQILERTGALQRSIKFQAVPTKERIDAHYLKYAEELNDGRKNKPKMKPRTIIELPDNWKIGGGDRKRSLKIFEKKLVSRIKDVL